MQIFIDVNGCIRKPRRGLLSETLDKKISDFRNLGSAIGARESVSKKRDLAIREFV